MEVAHFEAQGLKYSPGTVILMYHLNDAQDHYLTTPLGNGPST